MALTIYASAAVDGEHTGRWVTRKVSGKYSRTEYFKVGRMANRYQYYVYLEGISEYSCKWGQLAVERAVVNGVNLCGNCERYRARDGDYLCFTCRDRGRHLDSDRRL